MSLRIVSSDHYQLLGVTRRASPEDVERAYQRAIDKLESRTWWKRVAPVFGCGEASLREAADVLKDPQRRKEYDEWLRLMCQRDFIPH